MDVLGSLWFWLFDGYWPAADSKNLTFPTPDAQARYLPQGVFALGDVADIHWATSQDATEPLFLLKIPRCSQGHAHLVAERKALTKLRAAAVNTTYRKYLPDLVDSCSTTDRRVNVFRFEPGFRTLEQVHEQHPRLDGRHLAWIFKRLLTVLGFCHRRNVIHGAVLPCHVLVHVPSHGLQLVGWGQSTGSGRRLASVPAQYRNWYPPEVQNRQPACPATDLFLAARCLVYLAGGDPVTNRMPEAVPAPMRRFLNTCLLESPGMRPDDAWALLEEFDDLLQALYGLPKFHELTLT